MKSQYLLSLAAIIGIGVMIVGGILWERQITSVLLREIEQKNVQIATLRLEQEGKSGEIEGLEETEAILEKVKADLKEQQTFLFRRIYDLGRGGQTLKPAVQIDSPESE